MPSLKAPKSLESDAVTAAVSRGNRTTNSIRPLFTHDARVVILPVERAQKPGLEISVELVVGQEVFGRYVDCPA
jgi:hypothetical protein